MLPLQKWKCSWSLVATIASILALVSVLDIFLFHGVRYFSYFGSMQVQNSCKPINGSIEEGKDNIMQNQPPLLDLDVRFPADLHKAVVYRGAPWKAEIGRWLSGCIPNSTALKVSENVSGKSCKNDCSGQGICNCALGQCRCFHGFTGEGCSERQQLSCNFPGSKEQPYGRWVVSICPAYCDTTRAMCFCGESTKYPSRPVAEACGFKVNLPSEPGGPALTDWSKADLDNIFTTNASKPGWCNVDPIEAYSSKCDNGWYGADCSIPSIQASIREWPQWLRPAQVNIPDHAQVTENLVNLTAVVEKKRPLIYVYDLPPEFNSLLLEGRHFKLECVNRIYDDRNATLWTDHLYGSQMALYEQILASPYRTINGEEADYFFVPVLDSCIITRADDAPHLSMLEHMGLRSSLTLDFYKNAYLHIVNQYPYWNRSSGRDHIWSFSWDEGACYAPKEIWNSMMLVHWGNTNSKHNHSTTAYWADNWDKISPTRRGNHSCFDPDKDIVLPAWKRPNVNSLSLKLWARPRQKRKTFFYFNGNLGSAYEKGRPEATYSMGIRQKVAEEFGSSPTKEGKLGKQHADDVIVTPLHSENYHEDVASSIFCGVMPGDGWSGRMEDSILQGCIPVIIQDGIFLPYENVLNYESFAVRIREDEIPNMINILRGFNETEIEFMLENVKKIWQRFIYRDSILLEAERQKTAFGYMEDWAEKLSELKEDDVFATLIQVLHYKLHHEPWRQQFVYEKKEFGVPKECLIKT